MTQTSASKLAYIRDGGLCMWHLHKLDRIVGVFSYRDGYISAYAGTHHVFRRNRVDEPDAIISLCAECHQKAELAMIRKIDLVALLSKMTGIDLFRTYREFCRWGDEEWEQASAEIGTLKNNGLLAEQPI